MDMIGGGFGHIIEHIPNWFFYTFIAYLLLPLLVGGIIVCHRFLLSRVTPALWSAVLVPIGFYVLSVFALYLNSILNAPFLFECFLIWLASPIPVSIWIAVRVYFMKSSLADRRQSKRIKDLGDIARLVETHPHLWDGLNDGLKAQIERPK